MMLRFWLLFLLFFASLARAETTDEAGTFEQKVGSTVPTGLVFVDEDDRTLPLDDVLHKNQPTLLSLVYFHCQTLCPLIVNGVTKAINDMPDQGIGPFQLILVSIDPRDMASDARERKNLILKRSRSRLQADNLHILRGDEAVILKLADAVGFRYAYDPKTQQYEHPSGLVVLTPQARISRYFFGIEFDPLLLRQALERSSQNRLDHLIQQIRLACFRYNPETGTYTPAIYTIMRALAGFMLIGGAAAMGLYEYRRRAAGL